MGMNEPLVIVLGAGASKEFGLPLGSELIVEIAKYCDFKLKDFGMWTGGDDDLAEAIRQAAHLNHGSLNDYRNAAISIVQRSKAANSIDDLISSAKDEPLVAEVGKLAIARCLLEAEKKSRLYVDKTNFKNRMNFDGINETWLSELFKLIFSSATFEDAIEKLKKIKIISFNYDRCVKFYLFNIFKIKYEKTDLEIAEALTNLEILFPYGTLGFLDFEKNQNTKSVEFGGGYSDEIIKAANNLKTYSEATNSSSEQILKIRDIIKSANTLVFLGLAFHQQNLDLLYGEKPIVKPNNKTVIASTFGISDFNSKLFIKKLKDLGGYEKITNSSLTAYQTIKDYSEALKI